MKGRVLVVDDDRDLCELLEADLRLRGFEVTWVTTGEEALAMRNKHWDVILTDLQMPGMGGIDLCRNLSIDRPELPVVVLTAFGSFESAVAAIRAGAYDFVSKPIEMDMLALTLERTVKHHELQERVKVLRQEVERTQKFERLIGASAPMQELFDRMERVADTDASVLITGESGTGKELVARALHAKSSRSDRPFVAVNCPALPESLVESELFGHVRGSFTDARTTTKGLFFEADGGTLFFDEISELPLALQPKLLRALEERRVRPIGGQKEIPFDVRVLAATNRDIDSATEEGRFREDLLFRINVISIRVPPLRARGTDVLLIARQFVDLFAGRFGKEGLEISKGAAQRLLVYFWPGNVRELRNAIEHAVALTPYDKITVEDLPERVRDHRPKQVIPAGHDASELPPMEEIERRYILQVLEAVGGNRSLAARVLGMDRKTLYRKLQKEAPPSSDSRKE